MKKIISLCLCCCLVIATGISSRAEDSDGLNPLALEFINVGNVSLTFYVSDDGYANVQYTVAVNGTENVLVKTYIEKQYLNFFWTKIDTGSGGNTWTDRVNKQFYVGVHGVRLTESGVYRATIEVLSGSDKLIKRAEFRYNKSLHSGDVNADGRITAADARLILRFSAGIQRYTVAQQAKADINGDGRITAADARMVLRIAASLDTIKEVTA